jgi:hypothetical protein
MSRNWWENGFSENRRLNKAMGCGFGAAARRYLSGATQ